MLSNIKKKLALNHINIRGWQTDRKIIVIESDDWGSIRMPSKGIFNKLLKKGIRVDKCVYNKYDSLASEEDLEALFEILSKYRDINGNHVVITANTVVANPDFEKIEQFAYKDYFYEPFTETLKKYPSHHNSFDIWKQGIKEKIFFPQFHGREHVNVSLWLKLLQNKNEIFKTAFTHKLWGLGPVVANTGRVNIQASFDAETLTEIESHKKIIAEGLQLFQNIFEYNSKSFIANNFIWDSSLNPILQSNGVNFIQGMKYQKTPLIDKTEHPLLRHFIGERIKNQIYLIRNCTFEPTQNKNIDNVSCCLNEISNAFFWNKPAIITSHRLNFIGFIDKTNRAENLISFDKLLSSILKRWPEAEFMDSTELGNIIANDTIK